MKTEYKISNSIQALVVNHWLVIGDAALALAIMVSVCSSSLLMLYIALGVL